MNELVAYAICKNEEQYVNNFLEMVKPFDKVYVLDTGSTDNSIKLLKEAGVIVERKQYDTFDFSVARNDCLSLIDNDNAFCFSTDFKNKVVFPESEIAIIRSNKTADAFSVKFFYEEGDSYTQIENKVRVHRKNAYHWKYALHETLVAKNSFSLVLELDASVYMKNRVTEDKIKFYLDICEREYVKTKDIHYIWFMIEYYKSLGHNEKFLEASFELLNMTNPYNNIFRVNVMQQLSSFYQESGNRNKAIDFAFHSLSESITIKESYPFLVDNSLALLKQLNVEINIR